MIVRFVLSFTLFLLANISVADEIRPGYLELTEESQNTFSVIWKVPHRSGQNMLLDPFFPKNCEDKTPITSQYTKGAILQRWYIQCTEGMINQRIFIEGLENTNTDVLMRLKWLDGRLATVRLSSSSPGYLVPEKNTTSDIVDTYLWLGIEHILFGVDHLLFVFALLLIVKNIRPLIATITAFTLAHSITLGAATLGFVHVPQQPVEAVIALSILFLAMEFVNDKRGRSCVAAKWPWLVAFIFGLLHGFGFAGALSEIGLPQKAIPLALVFFNVGVEIGQLLFVATALLLGWMVRKLKQPKIQDWAETVVIYSIGGLSSFWLFERISVF
jgi:hydrogenase/urease accessory protein HupE